MTAASSEPGWYPDPRGEAAERKWDGEWLEVTRGHAGDGKTGRHLHLTDLDYLESIESCIDEIRRIVKFWGVAIPVIVVVTYVLAFVALTVSG